VIAPWSNCLEEGRVEWVPVSNPASCWVVDVREDGLESAFLQASGGRATSILVVAPCPGSLAPRPSGVSPPTSAGALPPEFIHGSCHFFLSGCFPPFFHTFAGRCECRVNDEFRTLLCMESRSARRKTDAPAARVEQTPTTEDALSAGSARVSRPASTFIHLTRAQQEPGGQRAVAAFEEGAGHFTSRLQSGIPCRAGIADAALQHHGALAARNCVQCSWPRRGASLRV
jgi:hypothetical protein